MTSARHGVCGRCSSSGLSTAPAGGSSCGCYAGALSRRIDRSSEWRSVLRLVALALQGDSLMLRAAATAASLRLARRMLSAGHARRLIKWPFLDVHAAVEGDGDSLWRLIVGEIVAHDLLGVSAGRDRRGSELHDHLGPFFAAADADRVGSVRVGASAGGYRNDTLNFQFCIPPLCHEKTLPRPRPPMIPRCPPATSCSSSP
jgi:hypothetical protein